MDKLGKKMPYTVPESFFETMEESLNQKVEVKKTKPLSRSVALWTGIAIAASLALLLVLRQGRHHTEDTSLQQVEMAFSQLSEADQELMLEYYEEIDDLDNY